MPTVAIVGASPDRAKFGNKATRAYHARGWTVWPVHPEATSIEGLPAFASLDELPGRPDRVLLYVPPAVGLQLLPSVAALAPDELFVNPGAGSPELLRRAAELGLPVREACAIVAIGESPAAWPA